jgi:Calcineurin-like phosphoesterase
VKIRRNFLLFNCNRSLVVKHDSTVNEPPTHPGAWLLPLAHHHVPVSTRLLIFVAVLSASLCLRVDGEPLRIVVAGDGRAEYRWNPRRPCDTQGINETVTRAISNAVLNENAAILLWTGDIVNVNDTNADTLKKGLEKWRGIMEQLYSKNVKVWPVRGNHEVYRYPREGDYDGEPIPDAAAVWKEVFSGSYTLPNNAPTSDDGLSFYSVEGSALIIGLDHYGRDDADPLARKHLVNQKWLDQVLNENKKPFTFVYGHEAAFMAGLHNDDATLAADASARNLFWQSLVKAKALYFCGHDHFYDRMSVVRRTSPPGPEMFQITAGTAGAPFYTGAQYAGSDLWKLQRASHFENVYGYMLIEVDRDKATITFKGRGLSCRDKTGQLAFVPMDQMVCKPSGCKTVSCQAP